MFLMNSIFLNHLATAVEGTGHLVINKNNKLLIEPVNIEVECEVLESTQYDQVVAVPVRIKATNENIFPEGIWEMIVGIGNEKEEAFKYAADVWTYTIFSVLHAFLVSPTKSENNVQVLNLASRNEESKEEFAWTLYLGPLQITGAFQEKSVELENTILVQKMLDALVGELYRPKLIWVRAYICMTPDNRIQGDCWLNNQNWLEGLSALYWYAEEWEKSGQYSALKQFMIVAPDDWENLTNAEELRSHLKNL